MEKDILRENFNKKIKHGRGSISFPCFSMLVNFNGDDKKVYGAICDYMSEDTDFVCYYADRLMAIKKYDKKDVKDYRSEAEYAKFLSQFVYEETGKKIKIIIGKNVSNFNDLYLSLEQNFLIEENFADEKLDKVYTYKQNLFNGLVQKISANERKEFIKNIEGDKIDSNKKLSNELILTAKQFLMCDLNVCETARKLYIHRNTLNYRLDKIEKILGLNIRVFGDAVSFYTYLVFKEQNERE